MLSFFFVQNTPIKSVKVAPAPTKRTLRSTGSSAVVNSSIPKSSSSNKKQNSLLVKNHEQMVVKRKATTVSTSPDLKKLKALSSKVSPFSLYILAHFRENICIGGLRLQ